MEVQSSLPEVVTLTSVKEDELSVSFLQEVGRAALYIFDLGYWCYALFDEIIDRQQHFLSRLKGKSNPLIKEVYVGEQPWVGCRWQEIDLGERRGGDLLQDLPAALGPLRRGWLAGVAAVSQPAGQPGRRRPECILFGSRRR